MATDGFWPIVSTPRSALMLLYGFNILASDIFHVKSSHVERLVVVGIGSHKNNVCFKPIQ